MKKAVCLALLMGFASGLFSQALPRKSQPRPTTSLEPQEAPPKPEDFRIFNGRLYNVMRSTNWVTFPPGHRYIYVSQKIGCGLIVREFEGGVNPRSRETGLMTRWSPPGAYEIWGKTYLLFNAPFYDVATTGDVTEKARVMNVGTTNFEGQTIGIVDYGLPNTPENRRSLTNQVAGPKLTR